MNAPRKILFKAKRKDNGEWVEGYYCNKQSTTYCFKEDYESFPVEIEHYIIQETMTDWGLPNKFRLIEIDPTTLSQFTGLYDKNGKRIFENDIVEVEQFNREDNYYDFTALVGYVHWCGGAFEVLGIETEDDEPYVWMHDCIQAGIQVIGNRFDNPELLEMEEV